MARLAVDFDVPRTPSWKNPPTPGRSCRSCKFDPWVGKIPCGKKWQPTPVLLPGKSYGLRSLVGYSPWGRKESDTTERLHFTSLSKVPRHAGKAGNPFQTTQGNRLSCRDQEGRWGSEEAVPGCLTLCDPMDCSLPGFSVHRIFQTS